MQWKCYRAHIFEQRCASQAPCFLMSVSMNCWNRAQVPLGAQNSEGLSGATVSVLSSVWTSGRYVTGRSISPVHLPWLRIQARSSVQRHCLAAEELGLALLQVFLVPSSSGWCWPVLWELEAQTPQTSQWGWGNVFDIIKGFILLWQTPLFWPKQSSYSHTWGTTAFHVSGYFFSVSYSHSFHVVDHQQSSCLWA